MSAWVLGVGLSGGEPMIRVREWAVTGRNTKEDPMSDQSDVRGVPDDAGPHADALAAVLRRIPDAYGHWIGCGPGWYPLIAEADTRLSAIDPDYTVHQVKQKFGTLRLYIAASESDRQQDEALKAVLVDVERRSTTVCEMCGAPGETVTVPTGWIVTVCPTCRATLPTDEEE